MLGFFTGMPGWLELVVIGFVVLLLFGNRLPGVARSFGQSIIEFKKGLKSGDDKKKEALPGGDGDDDSK